VLALREPVMPNPNNCGCCDHKRHADSGWCYMLRTEPDAVCLAHTARRGMTVSELLSDLAAMRRRREIWVSPKPPNGTVEPDLAASRQQE
jgi:hypothetical protein